MKRDPYIQLKLSEVIDCLLEQGVIEAIDLSEALLNYSNKSPINISSSVDDLYLFERVLFMSRSKAGHKRISNIHKKQRKTLQVVVNNANKFNDEFNLSKQDGYYKYCSTALKLMGAKYYFTKFITYQETIPERYYYSQRLNNLFSDDKFNLFIDYYRTNSGYAGPITDDFIITFDYCEDNIIDPVKYLKIQFKSFEWTQTAPKPYQLHTAKAIQRYYDGSTKNEVKKSGPDYSKLNKNK